MGSEEHPTAESRESPSSEFKKFGDFPQELQDLIWRTAALSVPWLYIVRAHITCIDSGTENPWISINPCEEVKERTRRLKPLLLACKKARKEVLRTLPPPLRFASFLGINQGLQTGQIHFDVEADVLCITSPIHFCRGAPVSRGGRMDPDFREGLRRIKNLGVQVKFGMAPNTVLSALSRGWSLGVSMTPESLFCLRAFIRARRFYVVAPPHVRKAPKPPKYHEGSFANGPKERHGDTDTDTDTEDEVGYMSHGPMWSNNPVLRSLQMADIPGSFGRTGQFGLTKVPVQQVQHVCVTDDSGQDLTPTLLSLWLSLCCRPGLNRMVNRALWYCFEYSMAQIGGQVTAIPEAPDTMMQYCGVLLPMVETYPLLKVYDDPVI